MTDQKTIDEVTARLLGGYIEIYESYELNSIVVRVPNDFRLSIFGYPMGLAAAYRQAKSYAKQKSKETGFPVRESLNLHW